MSLRTKVNDVAIYKKLVKFSNLDKGTRKEMISLFRKCEKGLMSEIPDFFTVNKKFLGFKDELYPQNTYIVLLYIKSKKINTKSKKLKYTNSATKKKNNFVDKKKELIGFLVMNDLMRNEEYFFTNFKEPIMDKQKNNNGLYFNWVCGNNRYSGIFKVLFEYFINSNEIKNSKYEYIVCIVESERSYKDKLISLYKSVGFKNKGMLSLYDNNDYHYLLRKL